ncbi:caspase family protein [Pantoea sp. Tr-811]|uniref:caspase family protein n=1 Tax=Pantoea sp. Tr-811 TaxID=2608361 RepID=UPI001962E937|nr:caspase family protein [Pantoea sp. Tr-811]
MTIGISNSFPLTPLPGAITAAQEIFNWASSNDFVASMITDEVQAVTVPRLREALEKLLNQNDRIDLFVLHFAGHGLRRGAEENIWLPSDWHDELRGISVEALKKRLYMRGIKSLTIISDACRSLPNDIETTEIIPDAVLPRGPWREEIPVIDRFNAVTDGQQAYMLPSDGVAPARCIFSSVLIEGLQGYDESVFDRYVKDCVIPESLALFSRERMRQIGTQYRLECNPEYQIGIPRDHTVYQHRSSATNGEQTIIWPTPPKQDNQEPVAFTQKNYTKKLSAISRIAHRDEGYISDRLIINQSRVDKHTNLIVTGGTAYRIWSTCPSFAISTDYRKQYLVELGDKPAAQVLIELISGITISTIVYRDLVTIVSTDKGGVIGWACVNKWQGIRNQLESTIKAISDIQSGNMSMDKIDQIAVDLRRSKHINPTLGAISSYLYDFAGDIDNIHRTAYYYCRRNQAIPFDIAFMGMLKTDQTDNGYTVQVPAVSERKTKSPGDNLPHWATEATPAEEGFVAGLWPWLHQGWQFVENPCDEEKPTASPLYEVIRYLAPSQFTSFRPQGAELLINKFNMVANS